MQACRRGDEPALLAEHGQRMGDDYRTKRGTNPRHTFRWRPDIYVAVRDGLAAMTQERCAYCDGYPLGDTGADQIDHFRPRSRYPDLVCSWSNLFFVCAGCNQAKRDDWDEDLLRPDDDDFAFVRYFDYQDMTGEIAPRADATIDDQRRAARTIEILKLNRDGKCKRRRETVRLIRAALREGVSRDELLAEDLGHRFLIPLVT